MTRVKICGITTPAAIDAAREADFAGFVFYPPSPRYVTPGKAAELARTLHPPAVAVTVDADDALLEEIRNTLRPNYFQLHGNETPERVREVRKAFGLPVIKAIGVATPEDVTRAKQYEEAADMLMFDARPPKGMPGGNGVAFEWKMLTGTKFARPWFLSGGITPDNVEEAVRIAGAPLVDVSSSLESSPGVKDSEKVLGFIKKVKRL